VRTILASEKCCDDIQAALRGENGGKAKKAEMESEVEKCG
jgi:hypothetical protein